MIHLMIPTPAMEQEAMVFKQAFYNAGARDLRQLQAG